MLVQRRRQAAARRHRQGHHPRHHRRDRHRRRHRLCHRICRRGDPRAVDGRPHDGLQHVDRGRRARRPDRARRDRPSPMSRAVRARPRASAWDMALRLLGDAPVRRGRAFRPRWSMLDAAKLPPIVSWGTSPEDVVSVAGRRARSRRDRRREQARSRKWRALDYMGLKPGHEDHRHRRSTASSSAPAPMAASRICAPSPRSSKASKVNADVERHGRAGLGPGQGAGGGRRPRQDLQGAGFEWREPGCSMCLAMNPDQLKPRRALRLDLEPQFRGPPGLSRAAPIWSRRPWRRRRRSPAISSISASSARLPCRNSLRSLLAPHLGRRGP